jgi:hypothetical protein
MDFKKIDTSERNITLYTLLKCMILFQTSPTNIISENIEGAYIL